MSENLKQAIRDVVEAVANAHDQQSRRVDRLQDGVEKHFKDVALMSIDAESAVQGLLDKHYDSRRPWGITPDIATIFYGLRMKHTLDEREELKGAIDCLKFDLSPLNNALGKLQAAVNSDKQYSISLKSDVEVRRAVWSKTDGRCVYCDVELAHPDHVGDNTMHVDHLVPTCAGGPDSLSNYVPACGPCNLSKSSIDPVAFVLRLRGKQPSQNVIPIESAS